MSDSQMPVRDLFHRKRSKLPQVGGFIAAVFVAVMLISGFIALADPKDVRITTDLHD